MNLSKAIILTAFFVTTFTASTQAAPRAINPVVHVMKEKPSSFRSFFGRLVHFGSN